VINYICINFIYVFVFIYAKNRNRTVLQNVHKQWWKSGVDEWQSIVTPIVTNRLNCTWSWKINFIGCCEFIVLSHIMFAIYKHFWFLLLLLLAFFFRNKHIYWSYLRSQGYCSYITLNFEHSIAIPIIQSYILSPIR
jgi:hypothetical protein